ncbi:hypothetical protein [Halalkalibacter urbisdiaboli]|uniref:hypothetical protein n=1 Tax=Halalkalibacter urbisdiaboli TaxID=1960589 RepID=UPI000B44B164|nr:hypothetical protein [Halalkalibacter urbisdiaboli]
MNRMILATFFSISFAVCFIYPQSSHALGSTVPAVNEVVEEVEASTEQLNIDEEAERETQSEPKSKPLINNVKDAAEQVVSDTAKTVTATANDVTKKVDKTVQAPAVNEVVDTIEEVVETETSEEVVRPPQVEPKVDIEREQERTEDDTWQVVTKEQSVTDSEPKLVEKKKKTQVDSNSRKSMSKRALFPSSEIGLHTGNPGQGGTGTNSSSGQSISSFYWLGTEGWEHLESSAMPRGSRISFYYDQWFHAPPIPPPQAISFLLIG